MKVIEEFLRNIMGVTDEQILKIGGEVCYFRNVPKGETVHRVDDESYEPMFLVDGLFRFYTLDEDGAECTDCFAFEPGMPIVPSSNLQDLVPVSIQSLEDSRVLVFPLQAIHQLMKENVAAVQSVMNVMSESLFYHRENKLALNQYNAAQRYEWFLQRYPGLIDRVPHGYIASFLGVTPVTLSRIRGQMK